MLLNLLRKELFTQKLHIYLLGFIWFIPMTLFFTDGSPIRHILLLIIFASWMPLHATYYEQPALVNSLPVTRKKIVTAKYLSGLLWFIPSAVIVVTYVFLFDTFAPFPTRLMTVWDLLLSLGCICVILSMFYPLHILYGYIAASVLTGVIAMSVVMGANIVMNIYHNPSITSLDSQVETVLANQNIFILSFACVSLLITLLSCKLAVRLYEKKDF
ncbi:ABC-2 transporter permease [Virgibacillus ainsalahensis]